jgi:hypothetical protein
MIDLYDQIHQLRAELRGCRFTRLERAAAKAQLDQLIAGHTERERTLDAALEALDNTEIPGAT